MELTAASQRYMLYTRCEIAQHGARDPAVLVKAWDANTQSSVLQAGDSVCVFCSPACRAEELDVNVTVTPGDVRTFLP